MNKRIEKLANIWANRRAEDEKLGIIYTFSEKALEQFAELIVRECAESLWTEECHTSDLAVEDYNRNWRKIKKHFGVEE